jgi:hypothetical protein
MTNFIDLEKEEKEVKKTFFTHMLNDGFEWSEPDDLPKNWKNVLHIGVYDMGESLFKCWDDNPKSFTIYRGIKGDEF